jgi:hypothetical protein
MNRELRCWIGYWGSLACCFSAESDIAKGILLVLATIFGVSYVTELRRKQND